MNCKEEYQQGIGLEIKKLLDWARANGVSPTKGKHHGLESLSEDQLLLVALLDDLSSQVISPSMSSVSSVSPSGPGGKEEAGNCVLLESAPEIASSRERNEATTSVTATQPHDFFTNGKPTGLAEASMPSEIKPTEGDLGVVCPSAVPAVPPADEEYGRSHISVGQGSVSSASDPLSTSSTETQSNRTTESARNELTSYVQGQTQSPSGLDNSTDRGASAGFPGTRSGSLLKQSIHLKNARINHHYKEYVQFSGASYVNLIDSPDIGLNFDRETGSLSGVPRESGDFTFLFEGFYEGRSYEVSASLAVIPDPRSLWVSKASDRSARYWKEDEDHDSKWGDLLAVAASKRGRSHAQEGLFRDDDFDLWTGGPGGWHVAAVADGAGSAKFSRQGARIAVKTITKELPGLLEKHLSNQMDVLILDWQNQVQGAEQRIKEQLYKSLAAAAFSAAKALGVESKKAQEPVSSFSTTLVMVVARKGRHGWFIAGFSIGDGGAAIFDLAGGGVVPLTIADSGEFAGQTRFLQMAEFSDGAAMNRIFFDVRDRFTAIFLMTDGVTDPKFPTDVALESFDWWVNFWEKDITQCVRLCHDNANVEQELLDWLDFWSPGNHDDRTIAILLP
jgi:hypothetical protein